MTSRNCYRLHQKIYLNSGQAMKYFIVHSSSEAIMCLPNRMCYTSTTYQVRQSSYCKLDLSGIIYLSSICYPTNLNRKRTKLCKLLSTILLVDIKISMKYCRASFASVFAVFAKGFC